MGHPAVTLLPMEPFALISLIILGWVIAITTALLLLYGVIRVAVGRGLRDHQKWMEKHRPQPNAQAWAVPPRTSVGQYFGYGLEPADPPQ